MTERTISRFQWTSRVLALLGLLGGIVTASDWLAPEVVRWSALATALLLAGARWCEQQIPARAPSKVPPAAVGLLLVGLLASGCAGKLDAAWRTMDGIIAARDATSKSLATWAGAEKARCDKMEPAPRQDCHKAAAAVGVKWRANIRPAINSALQVTAASVEVAERAKASKLDWMALLRPALCGLMRAAKAWGHYYPDKGAAVLAYIGGFEGVICD